jgi:hypothetical protein
MNLILSNRKPLVVYDTLDIHTLIAWALADYQHVYYVYTKYHFRHQGIATALLAALTTPQASPLFTTIAGIKLWENYLVSFKEAVHGEESKE